MRSFDRRMLPNARLHTKLMLASTLLVVLVVAACAYFVIAREREHADRQVDDRATQLADLLGASLAQPLWNVDRRAIDRQLGILARNPEVAELGLVADAYGPVATAAGPLVKAPGGRVVRVRPIEYSAFEGLAPNKLGEIRVQLSRAMVDESIGRFTRAILFIAAVVIVTLYGATHVLLRRMVRGPVNRLEAAVERIAGGDLDARCAVESGDELGQLAARFNAMADRLRESTLRLRRLIDANIIGVFIWDFEGRILEANDAFLELLGYDREDLVAGRLRWTDLTPAEWIDRTLQQFVPELRLTGRLQPIEKAYFGKDGRRVPVLIGAATLGQLGDQGVAFVVDLTERKRSEAERDALQERLRQSQKMEAIGTLAGGIAHDFNNILGAILGYGELAQRKVREGAALGDELEQVMQAGARGKRLVEHILAFSRSGIGHRVPVHVQSVVAQALALVAASMPPSVRLDQRLGVGDAAVLGDATQLHQVVMNLCTNAVQAMPRGGVLTVRLERGEVDDSRALSHGVLEPGTYVQLAVSDTGSGIAHAALERIFDPFFTTKGVGKGTGLGLSLVHGIVGECRGAIDVATREGAGTTFTVWLPYAGETAEPSGESVAELPQGNGESVMIVDDERALVRLAEETLAQLGYDPAGFESSVEALEAFRAEPQRYELVLTDQTMPELTGTDLAREIRKLRPDVPIVLMSGYKGPQLSALAQVAGVNEILHKPLVSRDIAEALARVLAGAGNRGEASDRAWT